MSGVASQYISRGKPCAGYDAGAFHSKADGNDHATATAAKHGGGAPEAAPTKSLHQQALDAGEQDEQER